MWQMVQEVEGWLAGQELITPDLTYLIQGLPSCQQEVGMGSDGFEELAVEVLKS